MSVSNATVQFRIRVYRNEDIAIGPGRIALLEAIDRAGSISGAARELKMSYRRAWLLVDETNKSLKSPAVSSSEGGVSGGGSQLTETGKKIIAHYRAAEARAAQSAANELNALAHLLAPPSPPGPPGNAKS